MKPIITTVLPHCSWLQFSVVKKNRQASKVHYCRRRILFLGRSWMVGVGQGVYLIWWQEKGQKKDSQSGKARGEQQKNKSFVTPSFSSAPLNEKKDGMTRLRGRGETKGRRRKERGRNMNEDRKRTRDQGHVHLEKTYCWLAGCLNGTVLLKWTVDE